MHTVIKTISACLTCVMALSSIALADVYKYRDARGHIHLTDRPMSGMQLLKRYQIATGRSARSPASAGAAMRQMFKRREQLQPLIRHAAAESQLLPALVHAVVRAESAYRTDAVSVEPPGFCRPGPIHNPRTRRYRNAFLYQNPKKYPPEH